MGFFNKKLIEGLTTGRYYCPECGELMEFEDENEDTLVCLHCGSSTELDEYGYDGEENLYPTREEVLGIDGEEENEE